MVISLAATSFLKMELPSTSNYSVSKTVLRGRKIKSRSLNIRANIAKFSPAGALKNNINGIKTSSPATGSLMKNKQEIASPLPQRKAGMIAEPFTNGRLLEDGLVFRQHFTVRSFDVGSDLKLSIVPLVNYLQETALNHLKAAGCLADGFGSTPEMSVRDLVWVICSSRMKIDQFPSWGDVTQIDTWICRSGKSGISHNWHVRDFTTGKTLMQASSLQLIMNKKTRKFAKNVEQVMEELKPLLQICDPLIRKDRRKVLQLDPDKADYVLTGLVPGWTDVDVNQHVGNVRLVYHLLKSIPCSFVERHELSAITVEYRKECKGDSVLESLSTSSNYDNNDHLMSNEEFELDHLLRLECGQVIARGRTKWKPKHEKNSEKPAHSTPPGTAQN